MMPATRFSLTVSAVRPRLSRMITTSWKGKAPRSTSWMTCKTSSRPSPPASRVSRPHSTLVKRATSWLRLSPIRCSSTQPVKPVQPVMFTGARISCSSMLMTVTSPSVSISAPVSTTQPSWRRKWNAPSTLPMVMTVKSRLSRTLMMRSILICSA